MKPNFHFIFLLLLQVWNIGLQQVDGADHPCKTPLGICGGDCDKRCKALYKGVGECYLGLCNCIHRDRC
jgi:hypothetical protein